jgi:hypothetical protein
MAKDDFKPDFRPHNPDAVDAAIRNATSLNAVGLQGLMNADVQAPLRKFDELNNLDYSLRAVLPLAVAGVVIGEAIINGSAGPTSVVASIASAGVVSKNRVADPLDLRIDQARSVLNEALKRVDNGATVPATGGGRNSSVKGRG